jgi:rhodanese-related sulfurtransferase
MRVIMKNSKERASKKKGVPFWAAALLVVVLVIAAGAFILLNANASKAQLPDVVSVSQAAALRDQGAFILDVRQPEEWSQFHIPGATLIPLGDLPNRLNEVPKDKKVVVYCRTGVRSAQGRDILRKAGYPQVTSLDGGITQWQTQGQQIATGS